MTCKPDDHCPFCGAGVPYPVFHWGTEVDDLDRAKALLGRLPNCKFELKVMQPCKEWHEVAEVRFESGAGLFRRRLAAMLIELALRIGKIGYCQAWLGNEKQDDAGSAAI